MSPRVTFPSDWRRFDQRVLPWGSHWLYSLEIVLLLGRLAVWRGSGHPGWGLARETHPSTCVVGPRSLGEALTCPAITARRPGLSTSSRSCWVQQDFPAVEGLPCLGENGQCCSPLHSPGILGPHQGRRAWSGQRKGNWRRKVKSESLLSSVSCARSPPVF